MKRSLSSTCSGTVPAQGSAPLQLPRSQRPGSTLLDRDLQITYSTLAILAEGHWHIWPPYHLQYVLLPSNCGPTTIPARTFLSVHFCSSVQLWSYNNPGTDYLQAIPHVLSGGLEDRLPPPWRRRLWTRAAWAHLKSPSSRPLLQCCWTDRPARQTRGCKRTASNTIPTHWTEEPMS